ncbi:MAG: rod shape-determining protein MreC [Geminicoccaceae bacterium]|nr:rod shape-determining protein MreC [Geminicoccaceae bacterium]
MSLKAALSRLFVVPAPLRLAGERLLIAGLVLAALALIVVSRGPGETLEGLRLVVRDPLVPVMTAARYPMDLAAGVGERTGALLAVYRENERLRAENERLRAREAESVRLMVENRSLRDVLRMPDEADAPDYATGHLIADAASSFVHTRLLDAGQGVGIEDGMPVLSADGLVGRVISVGRKSSRIMLLTDFNSKVPVLIEGSGDPALLEGDNTNEPRLRFLPINPQFKLGDRVVTSGTGGFLPSGLLVGEIARIDDDGVAVRPYADWSRLDVVSVLRYRPLPPPEADGASARASAPSGLAALQASVRP